MSNTGQFFPDVAGVAGGAAAVRSGSIGETPASRVQVGQEPSSR
jgi:hypothetical protein